MEVFSNGVNSKDNIVKENLMAVESTNEQKVHLIIANSKMT